MRVRGYAPATPCWARLSCHDHAAATAFYCGLFDWQPVAAADGTTVFTWRELPAAGLVGVGDDQQPAWLPFISTEDVAATAAAVDASGGAVLCPPAEFGTCGRAAMFADAEGAVFGGWQRGTFAGAQVVNEPNAVCWSEVATWDPAGAADFYGRAFGWADQPGQFATGIDYREWQTGNRTVAGLLPMNGYFPEQTPAHWRITIEVADCDAVASRCVELGGQVLAGPMDIGVGQYAQLADPDSAVVGVIELLPELRVGI